MACLGSSEELSLTREDSRRREEEAVIVGIGWEMMGRDLNASQAVGASLL